MEWLPEPAAGSPVCLGFDGSDVSDWTALRAETRDGFQFTPRYGPDRRPTIWNPAEWGGQIPRDEVDAAVAEVFERFAVRRLYADPPRWETDVDRWALRHGDQHVIQWATYRTKQMHDALDRFVTDLNAGRIKHDGCPLTALCLSNARKVAKTSDRYILGKPSQPQKIDAAMATVLAHEAASDERASGWQDKTDRRMFVFR
jgi:phage terminase large subunit-like protein